MQQKKNMDYPEVISMEEYLAKRTKIKENEQSKGNKQRQQGPSMLMVGV